MQRPRTRVRVFAPGRVNLIGDHTDYTGGLVFPMAIDLGTTIVAERTGKRVVLESREEPDTAIVSLDVERPAEVTPPWARYVAGVVAELRPVTGVVGAVTTSLPMGAGLSSSAALEVATALALGFDGPPRALAELCQRAEQRASGVPCGVMDQLASVAGVEGHALLIDCASLDISPVPLPGDVEVVAVHSGVTRRLASSAYAERRAQCAEVERRIGPLRSASIDDANRLADDELRRIARHVITENQRVPQLAGAMATGDVVAAGDLMKESHASLRDDYRVSTPQLDTLVDRLQSLDGVHGARLTGAGFGGCAIALCQPGAVTFGWSLRPSAGARVDQLRA